jgi:hypothetical protein
MAEFDVTRFGETMDRIYQILVKLLPERAHKLRRELVGELVGLHSAAETSKYWPKNWRQQRLKLSESTTAVKAEQVPTSIRESAQSIAEALEFLDLRDYLAESHDLEFAPWIAHPLNRDREKEFVAKEIVKLYKSVGGDTAKLPVLHVSPVYLTNVHQILLQVEQEINQDAASPISIKQIIGGVVLKTIHPRLSASLEQHGLMHHARERFLENANMIARKAGCDFSLEVCTDSSRWLRVGSYWPRLAPFHGLYVAECDWIHVGPWVPDLEHGQLQAWVISSYRISARFASAHFTKFRDALLAESSGGSGPDWENLSLIPPTAPEPAVLKPSTTPNLKIKVAKPTMPTGKKGSKRRHKPKGSGVS